MRKRITAEDVANRWGLTKRSVTGMCRNGRIEGAFKEGGTWYIPEDAEKPADGRVRSGRYKKNKPAKKLPLPIGISDYRIASTQYYYVDKTMMIKEFLDERPMVSLFTRPRRFGKTLNMDMLRTFFEKTDEDTSIYFQDKDIWKYPQYRQEQGKYPVIFVTFKDIKYGTWEETLEKLKEVIGSEFARHDILLRSEKCNEGDKASFERIMKRTAGSTELTSAFLVLTRMLNDHYGVAPIIIIDEYDTPIQQGHVKGFYDSVIDFMRNLFSGGLKDNKNLSFGFLTGILRVAKESIFSGLNNLVINSILDNKYSEYFGFTHEEVKTMSKYYRAEDRFDEICEWYDGYRFGNSEIFNPWSVINYFRNDCLAKAYWQSTGNNEIIGEVLSEAGPAVYDRLTTLLQGQSFNAYIDTGVIYPQIQNNPSSVFSFLLVAGYLKTLHADASFTDGYMCEVALPNKEISFVYKKEVLEKITLVVPQSTAISIQEAVYAGKAEDLQKLIRKLLLESASSFDTVGENFYHGLVLGLCVVMDSRYYIRSNRESGEGRYDIQLMPKEKGLPGILIELKAEKTITADALDKLAQTALNQIKEKQYDAELKAHGIEQIIKYGVAFSGKNVSIIME